MLFKNLIKSITLVLISTLFVGSLAQAVLPTRQEALFQAVINNDLIELESVIKNGVNLNKNYSGPSIPGVNRPIHNRMPIHVAAMYGNNSIIERLLAEGVDINSPDVLGNTPLAFAMTYGHTHTFEFLLNKGASPHTLLPCELSSATSPVLHSAIYYGYQNDHFVNLLIKRGMSVNIADEIGRTPLHVVASRMKSYGKGGGTDNSNYNNAPQLTSLLINQGADVRASDQSGNTPLHFAANQGHPEVVALLLKHGANVNAIDWTNSTPLHYASTRGENEIIPLLLQHGAELDVIDWQNDTPLLLALKRNNQKSALLLIQAGANIHISDSTGKTPLHWAAKKGHLEAYALLIEKGADVNAKDNEGKTPQE